MVEQTWTLTAEEVVPLLRKVDLFARLPGSDLETLAAVGRAEETAPGDVVFELGEPAGACYLVVEGSVELLAGADVDGGRVVAVRAPGEAFGEAALLAGRPHPVTARSVGEGRLLVIPREALVEAAGGESLGLRLAGSLASGLAGADAGFLAASPSAASRFVRRSLLPRNAPRVEGYDIAAGTTAEAGGDGGTVWDWFPLGDARPALAAYDVQGSGLPPSHWLMVCRTLLRALAADHGDLKEVLPRANAALSHSAVAGVDQFVECGIAVPGADGIEWSSAGRIPAGLIRRNGTFEEIGSQGPPLGMMAGFRYACQGVAMGPGDVFVALSQASMGLLRGAADLVAQVQGKPAGEVVSTLHRAVRRAQGEDPREISVIFLRKH